MNEVVVISYKGKRYIGYVETITANGSTRQTFGDFGMHSESYILNGYTVSIRDVKTNCITTGIFIESFYQIEPFEGDANEV